MYIDRFTLSISCTALLSFFFPLPNNADRLFSLFSNVGISCLFFLYGARLSRQAIYAGVTNWKLHLLIVFSTFILFPILGLCLRPMIHFMLTPDLEIGVFFVCVLPSTIQSSITLTSIAKGNVAAALCAASLSSLLGIFITPILLALLDHSNPSADHAAGSVILIFMQLCLPFFFGHIAKPVLVTWLNHHKNSLRYFDQSIILLIVYKAFSDAVNAHAWHNFSWRVILQLVAVMLALFVIGFVLTRWLARLCRLCLADEIAMIFCGSKKSLATGISIANVIFPPSLLSIVILPLMFYHQLQLIICTIMAQHYARK